MLRLWTCTDHAGAWPTGTASIVVAPDGEMAMNLLRRALEEAGLPQTPFTLQEVDLSQAGVIILCDGAY